MVQSQFKDKLAAIRIDSEKAYKECSEINTIRQKVMEELDCYARIIPDFFSYNNEAVRIKELYKKLHNLDYSRNRVISCIDVQRAGCLYEDYFEGMIKFVDNFINEAGSGGENISLMEKQLQTAMNGDSLFIDSLFGGKNNEYCNEELTSAITNVEYLVDFLQKIKDMQHVIADTCDRATKTSVTYEYIINAVRLMSNSAGMFCNRVISNIMDTYEAINDCLDDKPVKTVNTGLKVF